MKFLLVDDSKTMRNIQKKVLSAFAGAEFSEAGDGIEALSVIAATPGGFDLIMVDWNMPNMDGITLVKKIREKDGGLKGIKAMGFAIDAPRCAQVSMNVCDYRSTGLERVYTEVEKLAADAGVKILESELVGLAPKAALPEGLPKRIQLRGFDPKTQIIES